MSPPIPASFHPRDLDAHLHVPEQAVNYGKIRAMEKTEAEWREEAQDNIARRRLAAVADQLTDKIAQIATLMRGLTYGEMMDLAGQWTSEGKLQDSKEVVAAMLHEWQKSR